jgi:hypothetical protein
MVLRAYLTSASACSVSTTVCVRRRETRRKLQSERDAAQSLADVGAQGAVAIRPDLVERRKKLDRKAAKTYRVHFWRPVSHTGWRSREFEISGGDIVAVLDWADRHADDGETFTVFAVVDEADRGLGLVHLTGGDPTRASDT